MEHLERMIQLKIMLPKYVFASKRKHLIILLIQHTEHRAAFQENQHFHPKLHGVRTMYMYLHSDDGACCRFKDCIQREQLDETSCVARINHHHPSGKCFPRLTLHSVRLYKFQSLPFEAISQRTIVLFYRTAEHTRLHVHE